MGWRLDLGVVKRYGFVFEVYGIVCWFRFYREIQVSGNVREILGDFAFGLSIVYNSKIVTEY